MDFSKIALPGKFDPEDSAEDSLESNTETLKNSSESEIASRWVIPSNAFAAGGDSDETYSSDAQEDSDFFPDEEYDDFVESEDRVEGSSEENSSSLIDLEQASLHGDSRYVVNPFLDDDDTFQPFNGLDKTPGETRNVIAVEKLPEKKDSFDDMLEDFLSDDEFVNVGGVEEPSEIDYDISSSTVPDLWEQVKAAKPEKSSKALLPPEHDGIIERKDRLTARAKARKEGLVRYRDNAVEKGEKEIAHRGKREKLESEFGPAIKEFPVVIGSDGREVKRKEDGSGFTKRRTDAQRLRDFYRNSASAPPSSHTYLRQNGRLNVAEMEFFKNMQTTKKAVSLRDSSAMEIWKPSDDRSETEKERDDRIKIQTRIIEGADGTVKGRQRRFGDKEREVIDFLARFRYAKAIDFARMFGTRESTEVARLEKLRTMGLVIERRLFGTKPIWFVTTAGMLVSGFDLPRLTERTLTFSMFNHQFVVNHVAANLRGGKTNVLNLQDFPLRNRSPMRGPKTFGENLVSELQILSSLGKLKKDGKATEYRPGLLREMDRSFKKWNDEGGANLGTSPEMIEGNEWMLPLYPPEMLKLAWHVPDLVVLRDRNPDGSPESIAVEIEINSKPLDSYVRTLEAYKYDKRMYKKVIWVCKAESPARKLEAVAKEIGLWQDGRIDIVPIISEEGVITGRDLWMI